jgi:hypothetical protein
MPQLITLLLSNPNQILLVGLTLSTAIILADLKTGASLNLPGRGQLGAAGIVAGLSATLYYLGTSGIQGVLNQVASGIFGGLIIAALVGFYLTDR